MKRGKRAMVVTIAVMASVLVVTMLTPAGAHVTSRVSHLWTQHIKPKLANPGTLNAATNPVDWSKLKNVPGDFADGVDNVGGGGGGGDITGVTAGNGLNGGGTTGDVALSLDLQTARPPLYSGFHDAAINLPDSQATVATLPIAEAGTYLIFAKAWLDNEAGDLTGWWATCTLQAGGDFDETSVSGDDAFDNGNMMLMVTHTFAAPGEVVLACDDNSGTRMENLKISAIGVGAASNIGI